MVATPPKTVPPAPPATAGARRPAPSVPAAAQPAADDDGEVVGRSPLDRTIEATVAGAPQSATGVSYVVRLLLPEGDKRLVEIGIEPVRVGSGLDEIGLAGDPRARPGEGSLRVEDGRLWIDVEPDSAGVYRRIDGEETLTPGDVVLIGDVAAVFQSVPSSPPLDADGQVLGGAAATPCARLVFLRRDGSHGPAHDLPSGRTILGRTDGHLNFPQDSRLSRRHARFHATEEKVTIEDLDSRNGTYLRVRGRHRLDVGDALRVGSAGVQIRGRS